MKKQPPGVNHPQAGYRYRSPNVPLSAIRRFARQLAERFQPERIILFGSYAYGTPHEESDVDLLVVMPARNQIDAAIRLTLAFESPFSLDLIVRTPAKLRRGLDDGDWFLREIITRGKVLYEESDRAMGAQGRGRPVRGAKPRRRRVARP
jgi:predicted nucleotidyltransferase